MKLRTVAFIGLSVHLFFAASAGAQVTLIDDILAKVNDVQAKVNEIRANVRNSAEELANGLQTMGQEMREEIAASVAEVNESIQELRDDRAAFVANAGAFRTDLVNMFLNMENLSAELAQFTGLPITLELARERSVIGALPDRAMAPLYRALAAEDGAAFAEFTSRLGEAATTVGQLNEALNAVDTCAVIINDPQRIISASSHVSQLGAAMKLIGKGLVAMGATGISGKPVQVWGFAGIEIQNNRKRKWGERLVGVSDLLLSIANAANNKLMYCSIVDGTDRILARLDGLNLDLTNLDTPVSSRASQSSVDQLRQLVDQNLASATATAAVLEGIAGSPGSSGGQLSVLLRIKVEESLAENGNQASVALFYLPASRGGLLGLAREITEDTIVQVQSLNGNVTQAWQWLSRGDFALADSDFEEAHKLYARAYRSAAAGLPRQ